MNIVVIADGQPQRPYDLEALKRALQEGRISLTSLAWHEGRNAWVELQQIPEVQLAVSGTPKTPAAAGPSVCGIDQQLAVAIQSTPEKTHDVRWYFLEEDQTRGPHSTEEIGTMLSAGTIPSSTFVFREGLKDWVKTSSLAEFREHNEEAPRSLNFSATQESAKDLSSHKAPKRQLPRLVFFSSVLLICLAAILVIENARKQNAARATAEIKQKEEQAQAALKAKQQAEETARILKAEQERMAAVEKERKAREEQKRIVDEERAAKDYGIPTYSGEEAARLGFPVEDSEPKFNKTVEFVQSLFRNINLTLFGEIETSLINTNCYEVRWKLKDPIKNEFRSPCVQIYFGPQSRRIRQIDIWGGLNLVHREELSDEEENIRVFRAAVRSGIALVSAEDVDGVGNWMNSFPGGDTISSDFVKLSDFDSASVVITQITASTSFPTARKIMNWRVMIVPKDSAFLVSPGDWKGFPPAAAIRQNGYRAFVPRPLWKRFAAQ